jgi:hypothetical protein
MIDEMQDEIDAQKVQLQEKDIMLQERDVMLQEKEKELVAERERAEREIASLREEITVFIKQNKLKYRKKQERTADYFKNKDGTYTVFLKIIEPTGPLMELKFVVASRKVAKDIYKKWEEKASSLYSILYDSLVD